MRLRSDLAALLADACPSCFPGDAPAAGPRSLRPGADGCLSASYACSLCGSTWQTSWHLSPVRRVQGENVFHLLDDLIGVLAGLFADKADAA